MDFGIRSQSRVGGKKTLMFLFANSVQNINIERRQSAVRY